MRISDQLDIDDEDIRFTDLHMHTVYCDGKDTPEAMVQSAIEKGLSCIGFSSHSYVPFDSLAGIAEEKRQEYVREVARLKEVYAGKIRIFCGVELDYHTLPDPGTDAYSTIKERYKNDFDYIIGSVHYIPLCSFSASAEGHRVESDCIAETGKCCGSRNDFCNTGDSGCSGFAAVDDTPQILMDAVRDYFDGDYYRAAEAYYRLEADVVNRTGCDIIGHFDLFSKFNQKHRLFDEQHPRYVNAWKNAADQLIATGKVFEINTGGISRGWRDVPYPAPEIRDYIHRQGGRFILSSDSHNKDTIGCGFHAACEYL